MNSLDKGIGMEIKKDYLGAIGVYEEIILNINAPKASFINLSFIYWKSAAEFPFADAYGIPREIREIGGKRCMLILGKGLLNFPDNLEMHFWLRYYPHRLYFENFSEEDCREIIQKFKDDESIVPYFFLYLFDNEKFKNKRIALLNECERFPTAKNIYIKSILH
jgi:hypothetical protein